MKSFTERVKHAQEKQGLQVFRVVRELDPRGGELIDLITIKNSRTTFIHARGNGHGNLHSSTKLRLQMLGKRCGAKVLHAKVDGENELVFFRIYENEKSSGFRPMRNYS